MEMKVGATRAVTIKPEDIYGVKGQDLAWIVSLGALRTVPTRDTELAFIRADATAARWMAT